VKKIYKYLKLIGDQVLRYASRFVAIPIASV